MRAFDYEEKAVVDDVGKNVISGTFIVFTSLFVVFCLILHVLRK